jgi:phosphatidylserine/phosphatidylglycerophosphate/cardiolipin synthase-like enzyme
LLRTSDYAEADDAIEAVIRSAQDTIDIFEVSFSMELYCTLGVVMEGFCSMDDALIFSQALADVMEENGVKIRVLVTDVNMNGMENKVSIEVLQEELARRGISDQAEFRYYVGRMHPKALLADDELLIVGSQNFHYSAWGDNSGLAEYSLATDDPEAIEEFKRTFEYFWERGIPVDQAGGLRNES